MAKQKETNPGTAPAYSPCLHVDFEGKDVGEIKGVAVGDKVTLVVRGIVKGVEQRESYDDKKKMMASVSLRDYDVKIEAPTVWDDLSDEGE